MDNWVRVVDQASGEVFPLIGEVEPQLRREVEFRRAAQEQARLAEERERLAIQKAEEAAERERQALERADRETAARQTLEQEIARLRRLQH